jgi:hypothetical protein
MNAYGWTLQHAMSHTLYQLETMYAAVIRRRYDEYVMLSSISRVSQASKEDFEKFIGDLSDVKNSTFKKKSVHKDLAPVFEGFQVGIVQ